MNTQKIKIQVDKGLLLIKEMITFVSLAKQAGKSISWLNNKQKHNIINGKQQEFTQYDITLINNAVWEIAEKLLQTRITSEEPEKKIKQLSETVQMPYIYINKLGKTRLWYANRMRRDTGVTRKIYFSEDDIIAINMSIVEIGNKLLAIELTL